MSCDTPEKVELEHAAIHPSEMNNEGLDLYVSNCTVCHNPKANQGERIAPPMVNIKRRYSRDADNKEVFIQSFVDFLSNPSLENARMKNAIEKFGVMPNMSYSEDKIRKIAAYIYENEIESPEWLEEHMNTMHSTALSSDYTERGTNYVTTTKGELGKNLMGTIKNEGTLAALEFCNLNAIPILDSMATLQNIEIKRVTDKPRNLNNRANTKELGIIESFKAMMANEVEISPVLEEVGGKMHFYFPIKTNDMCMQCHGTPKEQIKINVVDKLAELYPEDEAIDYSPNQLRGIWKVVMEKD